MAQTAETGARLAEIESKAADRLTFFSDAVVAIAITLLALELPVPLGESNRDVLHDLNEHFSDFLAFFISFAVITLHWFGHHGLFRFVIAVPQAVRRWNMLWLLMIILTPFTTRVLSEDEAFEFRFILYASVQALAGLFFMLTVRALVRSRSFDPVTPPDLAANSYERLGAVIAMFTLSIPVALFTPWAYLCWTAIPLAGLVTRRIVNRGSPSRRR